jgi:hypothetical protein
MLTPARVRGYTGPGGALALLRDLGYPVAPVDVNPEEWRRGGVVLPWNGSSRLQLAARMHHFDLFVLTGNVPADAALRFLRSYREYNLITKSALLVQHESSLSICDLSSERTLRRLEIDLRSPSAHAVDRLNLLACGDAASLPRIYDRALDRESVTREFFQRFRGAVGEVAAALPGDDRQAADAEALLILSRLLFLSFVQEKGWLNGERRFLVDRLEREMKRGRELFSGVLLPLFFGALNTPLRERAAAARRLGRIPYLNGGLFEPSPFELRHPELHLPNELMQRVLEGVFERFDFRPDEVSDANGTGTHVDPEMLGKVFESLMAADERVASGSFYTPKEVVDLLTERAIAEWLGDSGIEKLSTIVILDPACGSGAFLLSALAAIEKLWRARTNDVPHDLRPRIVANSLFGVDLKPEAVRLCELRLWLAIVAGSDAAIEEVEPLPNLDRNILQGNALLSPTDFLGDARLDIYNDWLVALRAQGELLERYRTAPHAQRPALSRLIRGNDRRLASELLARSIDESERELQHACAPQRDLFGRAAPVDAERCRELQQRVAEQQALLEQAEEGRLDFFSFDVHFAPVMAAGGFDVVLGNPPWVRHSRIDTRTRHMLADRYTLFRGQRDGLAFHQPDLSVAFFERATALAKRDGVIALLMPSKIVNAAYAGPLRRAAAARVLALDDWSDDPRRRKWFDADTFPLGITCAAPREHVQVTVSGESFELRRELLSVNGATSEWALVPPDVSAILRRLRASFPALSSAHKRKPFMGVKTGDNRSFFLEAERIDGAHLVTSYGIRIPLTAVCRCVRGRDLRRWSVTASQWMLWPPHGGWRKPPRWLEKLAEVRGLEPADFRLSFVRPEHVGIKVAWKDLSRGLAAAVLPDVININNQPFPLIPNQTLYAIDAVSLEEAYAVSAVLNSSIAGALLVAVAERAKDLHFRYFGRTVAAMPWPDLRPQWGHLVRLSRRAHRGTAVQQEIDDAVARSYRVTPDELSLLQAFLARRLGG